MIEGNVLVDVHNHIYPMSYIELLERRQEIPRIVTRGGQREFVIFPEEDGPHGVGGRPIDSRYWDIERKLQFMDSVGIDFSVVSLGNPWLNPFAGEDCESIAEELNASLATIEGESDGRVVAMGVLPANSPDSAARAVKMIADETCLHGVVSGPSVAGLAFDEPQLDPLWHALSETQVPLFVHPEDGVAPESLQGYRHTLPVGLGFPMETTIAISRLVFGGVLERFPDLRILVAHGGGTLPYLAGRLDAAWRSDDEVTRQLPKPPSEYLKKLYMDSLVYWGPALSTAIRLVGTGQIMFGTDYPFSVADPSANLQAIDEELHGSDSLPHVVNLNAMKLFNLDEKSVTYPTGSSPRK